MKATLFIPRLNEALQGHHNGSHHSSYMDLDINRALSLREVLLHSRPTQSFVTSVLSLLMLSLPVPTNGAHLLSDEVIFR